MTPATIKTLMSLVGIVAGAAVFVPQLLPYQAALSALSAGLLAWAHGKRPGDESASRTAGLRSELELLKGEGPKTPRTGSVPPSAAGMLMLAGALALSPALPACSRAATPEAAGVQSAQASRLAYNAAAVTVQALNTVKTAWTDAVVASGDQAAAQSMLAATRKVDAALDAATGALARARQYLDEGAGEEKVRQQLRESVGFADVAVKLLAASGRPLPDKALDALGFLRGFLGAAPTGGANG